MEHAHHLTIRLVASAALVGLATTLAGCATPASTAGGPVRVSTEAHLDMSRQSAEQYVAGLVARARAVGAQDPHRQQLQAQVERYVAELIRKARATRDGADAPGD
jgi:hypothetical protein